MVLLLQMKPQIDRTFAYCGLHEYLLKRNLILFFGQEQDIVDLFR